LRHGFYDPVAKRSRQVGLQNQWKNYSKIHGQTLRGRSHNRPPEFATEYKAIELTVIRNGDWWVPTTDGRRRRSRRLLSCNITLCSRHSIWRSSESRGEIYGNDHGSRMSLIRSFTGREVFYSHSELFSTQCFKMLLFSQLYLSLLACFWDWDCLTAHVYTVSACVTCHHMLPSQRPAHCQCHHWSHQRYNSLDTPLVNRVSSLACTSTERTFLSIVRRRGICYY